MCPCRPWRVLQGKESRVHPRPWRLTTCMFGSLVLHSCLAEVRDPLKCSEPSLLKALGVRSDSCLRGVFELRFDSCLDSPSSCSHMFVTFLLSGVLVRGLVVAIRTNVCREPGKCCSLTNAIRRLRFEAAQAALRRQESRMLKPFAESWGSQAVLMCIVHVSDNTLKTSSRLTMTL